jgi:hypothetical protein
LSSKDIDEPSLDSVKVACPVAVDELGGTGFAPDKSAVKAVAPAAVPVVLGALLAVVLGAVVSTVLGPVVVVVAVLHPRTTRESARTSANPTVNAGALLIASLSFLSKLLEFGVDNVHFTTVRCFIRAPTQIFYPHARQIMLGCPPCSASAQTYSAAVVPLG